MNGRRVVMNTQSYSTILSILVVPLYLALGGCKREPPALAATPPPVVMVSPPVEREITDYYEATGRTAAVESVDIRARVSGYLVKVNFREGAVIKKGDLLFQIDPRPFQAVLDEARGQVAQWEAKLARAEADVTRYDKVAPERRGQSERPRSGGRRPGRGAGDYPIGTGGSRPFRGRFFMKEK